MATNAYAGTTNLVCELDFNHKFHGVGIKSYKETKRISIFTRGGAPIYMSGFQETECFISQNVKFVCGHKLPFGDNKPGYFDKTFIIEPDSGSIIIIEKQIKNNKEVAVKAGSGHCKISRHKKLF